MSNRCMILSVLWLSALHPLMAQEQEPAAQPPMPLSSDFPLLVEVDAASNYSRTGGPVSLILNTNWAGPGVLNGTLVLQIYNENELLGTFQEPDLFLSGGQQLELLVPPLTDDYIAGFLQVYPAFVRDGTVYPLAAQQLRVTGTNSRKFLLTVSLPEGDLERGSELMVEGLDFDVLTPSTQFDDRRNNLLTLHNKIAAEELPTNALGHCVRNCLALSDEGLAVLDEQQLEALLAWIRAGGSLYVNLDDAPQGAAQLDFLNQFLKETGSKNVFLPSSTAAPQLAEANVDNSPLLMRYGLGHVAIIPDSITLTPDLLQKHVGPFLWKLRDDQRQAVAQTGTWSFQLAWSQSRSGGGYGYGPDDLSTQRMMTAMHPMPSGGGIGLVRHLLPRGFTLVPLWLVGLVLAAFILVIGPVDYLWLGMFTSRKWTWISFPVMAIMFTCLAITISNHYMSTGDHRGRMVIRDIVPGGLIARENELQLIFNSVSSLAATDIQDAIFTPLVYQRFTGDNQDWYNVQAQRQLQHTGIVGRPVFEGSMPRLSVVKQSVPQWTPQLNRTLRISDSPLKESSSFDWDLPIDWDSPAPLVNRIREAFGSTARAHLYRRIDVDNTYSLASPFEKKVLLGEEDFVQSLGNQTYQTVTLPNGAIAQQLVSGGDFVSQVSMPESRGLFGVSSQTAPTGGDQFEDLALFDRSDTDDILLIIMIPERDGSYTLLRRLYQNND